MRGKKKATSSSRSGLSVTRSGLKLDTRDLSLLNRSIYGFKESMIPHVTEGLVSACETGARVAAAYPFWEAVGELYGSVVDLACGVGTEMTCASAAGLCATAWDASPEARAIGALFPSLMEVSKFRPTSKHDLTFIDWDWGESYNRESKTLTYDTYNQIFSMLATARSMRSELLVSKCPKKVIGGIVLEPAFQVDTGRSDTTYLVYPVGNNMDMYVKLISVFEIKGFSIQFFSVRTQLAFRDHARHVGEVLLCAESALEPEIVPGVVRFSKDYSEIDLAAGETPTYEDNVETRPSHVVEGTSKGESGNAVAEEGSNEVKAKVDELIYAVQTWDKDLTTTLLEELVLMKDMVLKYVLETYPKLHKIVVGLFDKVKGPPSQVELPPAFKMQTRKGAVLSVGETSKGFMCNGVFVTCFHATKGASLQLGGALVEASEIDTVKDLVSYGGPIPRFSRMRKGRRYSVMVANGHALEGVCISENPSQVCFPGAPVPGLSGSPIFSAAGEIVGMYANHLLDKGKHISIQFSRDWTAIVSDKVKEHGRVNLYVSCGAGKSTYLPTQLLKDGVARRILMIVPRGALVSAIAGRLGNKARGFSGEESIEDHDCDILVLTHGKFLEAVDRNSTRFSSYDLTIVDEAHDLSALTEVTKEWIEAKCKKAVFMTGSPSSRQFTSRTAASMKFKMTEKKLRYDKPLSSEDVVKEVKSIGGKSSVILVQVPTVKMASKINELADFDVHLISRANIDKRGMDWFHKLVNSGKRVVLCATSVVSLGITLNIDAVLIQGELVDASTPLNGISSVEKRRMTYSELWQFLARCGRNKPGLAVYPDIDWADARLSQSDVMLCDGWRLRLGLTTKLSSFPDSTTVEQIRTAMKMDMSLNAALGLVDSTGVLIIPPGKSVKSAEERRLNTREAFITHNVFSEPNKGAVKGTSTGYDPMAAELNEVYDLGPVSTGFLSIAVPVVAYLASARESPKVIPYCSYDCSSVRKRFKNFSFDGSSCKQPALMITPLDCKLGSDEVLHDSVETSFVDEILKGLLTWLKIPTCVSHGATNVVCDVGSRKFGTSLAYYLSSMGVTGDVNIMKDDCVYKPTLYEKKTGVLLPSTEWEVSRDFGFESVSTSYYWSVLPCVSGVIFGPAAVVAALAISWLSFGKVPPRLERVQKGLRKIIPEARIAAFEKSPIKSFVSTGAGHCLAGLLSPYLVAASVFGGLEAILSHFKLCGVPVASVQTGLPSWNKAFYGMMDQVMLGFAANGALWKFYSLVHPALMPGWSRTADMSTMTKLAQAAGLFKPASFAGVPLREAFDFMLCCAGVACSFYGPMFQDWTLWYPSIFAIATVVSLAVSPRYINFIFLCVLAYHVRLQKRDISCMMSRGKFKDFTNRDTSVRVFAGKVFQEVRRVKKTIMEKVYFSDNLGGDDKLCVSDGDEKVFLEPIETSRDGGSVSTSEDIPDMANREIVIKLLVPVITISSLFLLPKCMWQRVLVSVTMYEALTNPLWKLEWLFLASLANLPNVVNAVIALVLVGFWKEFDNRLKVTNDQIAVSAVLSSLFCFDFIGVFFLIAALGGADLGRDKIVVLIMDLYYILSGRSGSMLSLMKNGFGGFNDLRFFRDEVVSWWLTVKHTSKEVIGACRNRCSFVRTSGQGRDWFALFSFLLGRLVSALRRVWSRCRIVSRCSGLFRSVRSRSSVAIKRVWLGLPRLCVAVAETLVAVFKTLWVNVLGLVRWFWHYDRTRDARTTGSDPACRPDAQPVDGADEESPLHLDVEEETRASPLEVATSSELPLQRLVSKASGLWTTAVGTTLAWWSLTRPQPVVPNALIWSSFALAFFACACGLAVAWYVFIVMPVKLSDTVAKVEMKMCHCHDKPIDISSCSSSSDSTEQDCEDVSHLAREFEDCLDLPLEELLQDKPPKMVNGETVFLGLTFTYAWRRGAKVDWAHASSDERKNAFQRHIAKMKTCLSRRVNTSGDNFELGPLLRKPRAFARIHSQRSASSWENARRVVRSTNWFPSVIIMFALVFGGSILHPMLGLVAFADVVAYVSGLIVFSGRFTNKQLKEFDKSISKFAQHEIFGYGDVYMVKSKLPEYVVPPSKTKRVLVVGVAGDKLWLERALGLFFRSQKKISQLSLLIIADNQIGAMLKAMALPELVSFMVVDTTSPAAMRSARMIPMFCGDPTTYYLHRDADWDITPLELAAVELGSNLCCNPLGMSPSPVLMASVNYWGAAYKEHFYDWYSTRDYWTRYGHDEIIATRLGMDHVYNKLTPIEERLFYSSCVPRKMSRYKIHMPTRFVHNSEENLRKVTWTTQEVASYGDSAWRRCLHKGSSNPNTYCGRKANLSVVQTGHFNAVFFTAMIAQIMCHDNLDRWFFDNAKKNFYANSVRSSFRDAVGVLYGLVTGCKSSSKMYDKATAIMEEDSRYADNFAAWRMARGSRGVANMLSLDAFGSTTKSVILWSVALANPAAFGFASFISAFAPHFEETDVMVGLVYLMSGTNSGVAAGILRLVNSFVPVGREALNMTSCVALSCVATGEVPWWGWHPAPRIMHTMYLDHLGKDDGSVSKSIYPVNWERGWVMGWGDKAYNEVSLPVTMINLRCSTFIALSRYGFCDFKLPSDLCILGSGIGGIAQGVLHEGFRGDLTTITLPDTGFETHTAVHKAVELRSISHQDLRVNILTYQKLHQYIVLDVSRGPDDPLWWSDDFSHRDEILDFERQSVVHAISLVRPGGTFVMSVELDMASSVAEFLLYCSLHFRQVQVVEDPLRRHFGFVWIVCHKKLTRKSPAVTRLYPGFFSYGENEDEVLKLYEAIGDAQYRSVNESNSWWQTRLFNAYKPVEGTLDAVDVTVIDTVDVERLDQDLVEFLEEAPIFYENSFVSELEKYDFVAPSEHRRSVAFSILGTAIKPPVPDRQFNAGVDLFAQIALRQAGVLPLSMSVDVPPQTNFKVMQGLFKRYDFEEPFPECGELKAAFGFIFQHHRNVIEAYDFTPPTWEVMLEELKHKSSMSYMSTVPAKDTKDALKNFIPQLDEIFYTLIYGGKLNLAFCASPKVEKKKLKTTTEDMDPRLFVYREGGVRLASVRLYKRLNDFMADRKFWYSAFSGDAFAKAELIVSAFGKYKKPAACVYEAVKWDGHVCSQLYVCMRKYLCHALRWNRSGHLLADVLQSTTLYDVWGHWFLCDGTVVKALRGSKKSGEPDTSYGNKLKNDGIDLVNQKRALSCSYEECVKRIFTATEGDDKVNVGELEDIELICGTRNTTYAEFGIPQEVEAEPVMHPELLGFCSYGYTRLSNGICVPVRDLNEVFAKLLIPCANGQFRMDFGMASRSLTSVISLVAIYWYLPEVRRLYEAVTFVIPKDVIAASVAKAESWKFFFMLGIPDPTKFNLENYLVGRFGRIPYGGRTNEIADGVLNIHDFRSLRHLSKEELLENVLEASEESSTVFDVSVWYEELVEPDIVEQDLQYFADTGMKVEVFCESPSSLRASYLNGSTKIIGASFSKFFTSLRRSKCTTFQAVFSDTSASSLSYYRGILNGKNVRKRGFRGAKISLGIATDQGYEHVKTIKTSFLGMCLTSIIVCCILYWFMDNDKHVQTAGYVRRGLMVKSRTANLVFGPQPVRKDILKLEKPPHAACTMDLSMVLACANLEGKLNRLSVQRNTASKHLSLMVKHVRRFGVLIYDDAGVLNAYLVYAKLADRRIANENWVSRERMARLLDVDVEKVLPAKEWTVNGGMLTAEGWHGEFEYGQLERPMKLFLECQVSLRNIVLFVRISDIPCMRLDGREPNTYMFTDKPLGTLSRYAPTFGESSDDQFVDLPKPYDAEILHHGGSIYTPWSGKTNLFLFRGGTTGAGVGPDANSRDLLVESAEAVRDATHWEVSFEWTSVSERVTRSLTGVVSKRDKTDYAMVERLSYMQQSHSKCLVVVEGNEAPDRTLLCMLTGSVVLYVRPTHCLGKKSWFEYFLQDKEFLVMADATRASIVEGCKFIAENDARAAHIASRGKMLAERLVNNELRVNYVSNTCSLIIRNRMATKTHVDQLLGVIKKMRGQHSFIMEDRDHGYTHGSAVNLQASTFSPAQLRCDIGCGVALFQMSPSAVFDFNVNARTLLTGPQVHNTLQHLSIHTLREVEPLFAGLMDNYEREAVLYSIGTLGSGNHFVELVYKNGFFLLVHSGSRRAPSACLKNRENMDLESAIRVNKLCQRMATLNRACIARHFGAGDCVLDTAHTTFITPSQAEPLGLGSYYWLIKDLLLCTTTLPLLGGPGSGMAIVDCKPGLQPHGMGGKGNRVRHLDGIPEDRWYKTVLHCAPTVIQVV